jgi:hypothetical protein
MSQRKELEITIAPDGTVSVQVKCVVGQSCVDETKFLEDALGNTIESREFKPEYYENTVGAAQKNRTGG